MNISMLDYVIQQLLDRRGSWPTIAKDTGVPRPTLGKIARGEIEDPGVRKVEKLEKYFRLLERQEQERAAVGGGQALAEAG